MPPAKAVFAEFVGTFALMLVGGGAIMMGGDLVAVAAAHGLILAVMVSATLHLSGAQFNPAVSIAVALVGRQPWPQAILLITTQLAATTIAALILKSMLAGHPPAEAHLGSLGATLGAFSQGPSADVVRVIVLEIIATFFLMFVIMGSAVDGRSWTRPAAGFAIGLTVFALILFIGPLTGASMNPARSFGPALVSGSWTMHWAYWVAPIIGASLAASIYQSLCAPPRT
jgi:MIP family channel proteins